MLALVGSWWMFVLRGVIAIVFGLLTAFMPGMALLTLVLLYGAFALIEGVFSIASAVRHHGEPRWGALLFQGLLSAVAGLIALFVPGLTALALLYLIAFWALATGVLEIAAAIRLRKHITGEWRLALMGVASLVFGVLCFLFPGAGALTIVLWIGVFAIVYGILLIALGLRLRSPVITTGLPGAPIGRNVAR